MKRFSNGVELAKALFSEGANVFGWDMEWNMNYNINRFYCHSISLINIITVNRRYRYGGNAMFHRLNAKGGKLPGKIVVLTHDIAHR